MPKPFLKNYIFYKTQLDSNKTRFKKNDNATFKIILDILIYPVI